MRQPRFTVVVPALDEADQLGLTLASLAAQDVGEPFEVLVVDNGSRDRTAELARRAGVRVVGEPVRGVCAARQRGVDEARGEFVVCTDADTRHRPDWLSRLDAQLRAHPGAVAVAGPCRYLDAPGWARVLSGLGFALVTVVHALTGRVLYVTATNVAYRREGFPGYDILLTQGGDEVDLLRRLQRVGPVRWDRGNAVATSARRLDQGMLHTLVVSYGYYYALASVLNRLTRRRVIGVAPAIRDADGPTVRRRRLTWRWAGAGVLALLLTRPAARRLRAGRRPGAPVL